MEKLYVPVLVVAFAAVIFCMTWQPPQPAQTLGQCLSQKGVVMYGTDTCEYCLEQKEMLAEDFLSVAYVNCAFQESTCREKGVTVYPVWMKENDRLVGVQSREKLAEFAGCEA